MSQEKDCNLLRPFDLEAAKRGEKIHDVFGGAVVFIDGPDAGGKFALRIDGHFASAYGDQLRMAPLCWVEGRPVYEGDVLYSLENGRGVILKNHKFSGGYAIQFESAAIAIDAPYFSRGLTWTPPKVKREGWVNIYPGLECGTTIHTTREIADAESSHSRTACIRIEWEEPAGLEGGAQ